MFPAAGCFVGLTHLACYACRAKVKLYYAVEGAFYTASVFMLLFWEERRKDFHAMLLHHVATSSLIAVSYFFSCAPHPVINTLFCWPTICCLC